MQAACEAGGVLALLEGGAAGARAAAEALGALYGAAREPWLVRGLLAYHERTGSQRALALLARAPEPHARFLLDALADQLRGGRAERAHALAALATLVTRRPAWLRLLPPHAAARELLRAARAERDAVPRLHALLALAALLPAAPALGAAHAGELAEAALRAAAGEAHAALAARALWGALYALQPCAAVEALRAAGGGWERAAAALAGSVRLHAALVTGGRTRDAEAARWARAEPHDVLAECRRLALPAPRDEPAEPAVPAPPEPARKDPPPPGCAVQASSAAGALRPGGEGWFSLGERSGAEAAPHTPLPAEPEPEPEPAVEATPENTPRLAFRFPAEGGAARALSQASPGAPAGPAPRLARLVADRSAAERRSLESPVPIGGAPPAAAARPEPRPAAPDAEPEDREVRELTARAAPPPDPADAEPERLRVPDPRARAPAPRRPRARAPPPHRAASAPPRAATRRADAAAQTVDAWPEPYEFIAADMFRAPPERPHAPSPTARLDDYLAALYEGRAGPAPAADGGGAEARAAELAEQLALVHAQLMYERWRREAHAERNRRLLGRCRQVRALELHNSALQERVRALTLERDALRERRERAAAPDRGGAPEPALEAELRAERAARLRADAARHEAEAERAHDRAELQRTRAESVEAARHAEALARAALAAERRGEHVRRLRRELLVLGEREARLRDAAAAAQAAAAGAAGAAGGERALRAAAARAEAEAEAAGARAEAASARVHELEAALAARDAAVAELKRATRHAAEESAARTRAMRDKYAALLAMLRTREARDLERLAA